MSDHLIAGRYRGGGPLAAATPPMAPYRMWIAFLLRMAGV